MVYCTLYFKIFSPPSFPSCLSCFLFVSSWNPPDLLRFLQFYLPFVCICIFFCNSITWSLMYSLLHSRCNNFFTIKIPCLCTKSLQFCLTLCDPMDCSTPGSSVSGILQARTLEWVALLSSYSLCFPFISTSTSSHISPNPGNY